MDLRTLREAIVHAKCYEDIEEHVAPWTGEQEFAEIVEAIEKRGGQRAPPIPLEDVVLAPLNAIQENGALKDVTTTEVAPPLENFAREEVATMPSVSGLEVPTIGTGGEAIAVQ